MRINRLDLTRYGKFTDGVLDFGSRPIGSPDLHIIYGPNEAGKSTTFDAIVDLIFGIGTSTKYGFLHPYPTMRIGANISVGGQNREFVRIKRPQNSLFDDTERTLPDADIRADLGGIDRDAFSTMFSLDDENLEKGGEGILASKGDLGELLFAASAGLADLSKQLTLIRADADGFYKYRARSGALGELKARLVDLKQQREALDLQASEHQRLVNERTRLARLYDEAIDARAGTQRRIDEIKRVLNALPIMARLNAFRDRLAGLEVVPEPPGTWRQEIPELKKEEIELRVKQEDTARLITSLEAETSAILVDQSALEAATQAEELAELRARYVTAEKDIPKLAARAAELSIESMLLQLGRPEEQTPERLLLNAATVGTFRELIGSKSGVDAKWSAAQEELARVERLLALEAEREVDADVDVSSDLVKAFEALQATVKATPKSDHDLMLRSLVRRHEAAARALSEAMNALLPWRGTVEDLGFLVRPLPHRFDAWKSGLALVSEQDRASRAELERLEPEARRLDAEIGSLRVQVGSIDEATATASRASREAAWAAHRRALDAASADAFVEAMRADDQLVAQRLLHFADMGKLNQLLLRQAAVGADIHSQQKSLENATTGREAVRSAIRQSLGEMTFSDDVASDPWELEEWFRKREVALKTRDELATIADEIASIRDQVVHTKRSLVEALTDARVPFDPNSEPGALVGVAEKALDDFHASADTAAQIERLRQDVAERSRLFHVADEAATAWLAEWEAACNGCWLHELGRVPNMGAVSEILTVLERLASAVTAREGLIDRIEKMEKDQTAFDLRVRDLSTRLGVEPDGSPVVLCQTIIEKIRRAGVDADLHEKLERDLEEARRLEHRLKAAEKLLSMRVDQMVEFFGVTTLDEVERCIDLSARRRDAMTAISETELELVQMSGVTTVSEVEELTGEVDRTVLEEELARLAPVLEDQDVRCREVFHSQSKAQDALDAIGGDAKVAELEEQRRTTLLEIEENARRYMELRAGVAAAEHGLKLYRDRHRSGMMARASDAFRTISRGAYEGVAAQPGKDGDVLIAVSASGGSKATEELSKGARFQLYLALRVAGYHEFASNRTPIPFIADDILETFDDDRAEETFRLFAGMGMQGQVIYLTHHKHLTDIARKVCPSVRLHDLEKIGKPARPRVVAAE
ncbi:AAA family ATPase [Ensifer adhaerens]|uniref:ATP-binding protein n=1 Tax=Ensifer adhaerens TaxID=106592 RepID=UPI003F84E451